MEETKKSSVGVEAERGYLKGVSVASESVVQEITEPFEDADEIVGEGAGEGAAIKAKERYERIKELKHKELRGLIETYYDIQKLRIATASRLRTYRKAGLNADRLFGPMSSLGRIEDDIQREIKEVVEKHPLWDAWFSGVKGIGPVMAAGIIAWRDDISKAPTISAFWKYHGMAPGQRRKRGEKIDYNPRAKTHAWKCGMQLLKAKGRYSDLYYRAKIKYEDREDIKEAHETGTAPGGMKSYKLHIHLMALRKMIKQFLADTWLMWRTVEGLEVTLPYIFGETAKQKGIAHEHFELPKTDAQAEHAQLKAASRQLRAERMNAK